MIEAVGMALLSSAVKLVFQKLASPDVVDLIRGKKLTKELLQKFKTAVLSVNAVLEDAEEKQITNSFVRDWIDELKDALYDADDILDGIATEAMRSKLEADLPTTMGKVRSSISTLLDRFINEVEPKIKGVVNRVDNLAKQKDLMGLQEIAGRRQSKGSPTTPSIEESGTFGRNDDKKAIIDLLAPEDASHDKKSVIAIVGMGGVGKTTLAQLVYSDSRVKQHFNLEVWSCISEEFVISKVQKSVIEAVTSSPCNTEDPTQVEEQLKKNLLGKKFLIVLDDVWSEDRVHQEFLSKLLQYGVQGSKVVITTRNDSVANAMRASATHRVKKLSDDDCWLLFAKQAFGDVCSDSHKELEAIGREIIKKCEYLPLAVKAIGALLWSQLDADEWNKILKSDLWDLPINETDIQPALRLSYIYLPSHLKQCFAYCSLFLKDSSLEKDRIVLLWMAEGFLQSSKFETMEEVGHRYFLDLVARSLLQQSSDKALFGMHDLIHDLAKSVAGQFTFTLEQGDTTNEIGKMTRHFSCSGASLDTFGKFEEALSKVKQLRTFLTLDSSSWQSRMFGKNLLQNLLPTLSCLRVLSIPHNRDITYLPDSIGKLKHLRYLDLSFTTIKRLPKSTWKLINLQTLKLSGCEDLVALPEHMWKLTSLRHLDIAGTGIKKMPEQLDSLKCLNTLTKFVVGKGTRSSIRELGKLKNLQGTLSISKLQNVVPPKDAVNAGLKDKKDLEKLALEWDATTPRSERIVLESLRPHTSLKSLTIQGYGGGIFPEWVGHQSFSCITSIHLDQCRNVCSLPPFGQLCSLKELSIVGLDRVVTVDREFCGNSSTGSSSIQPFGGLKVLRFDQMWGWEEWLSSSSAENEGGGFPDLKELCIRNCPKLTGGLPIHIPSLAKLEIKSCPKLLASLLRSQLGAMSEYAGIVLEELPTGRRKLEVSEVDEVASLEGIMDSNSPLQELQIDSCDSLMSLPWGGLLSALKSVSIHFSRKLELPIHTNYSSLETLSLFQIWDSLKSFPLELFPKLKDLTIWWCDNLECLTVPEQHERDLVISKIFSSGAVNLYHFQKEDCMPPILHRLWSKNVRV